jgi:hypothetical protein
MVVLEELIQLQIAVLVVEHKLDRPVVIMVHHLVGVVVVLIRTGGGPATVGGIGGAGGIVITYTSDLAHCSNGVQDCGETGIDCGGNCAFCPFTPTSAMSETTSSGSTNFTGVSAPAGGACATNEFDYLGGPTVSGACVTMTPANTNDNAGAIWACNSINLDNSFKVTASVTFGSNTAQGDGVVFVLKEDSRGDRIGRVGGYIGYHEPTTSGRPIGTSIGVEYDTYNVVGGDNGDTPTTCCGCNHAQIVRDGDLRTKIGAETCLKEDGTSVNDGLAHNICILWNASTNVFQAYIDNRLVASAGDLRTYFGTKTVYWGFTAGDGAGTNLNNHIICRANIQTANPSTFTPICVPVVLPVELSYFKVNSNQRYNELLWQTYSERENDYFIIEKSSEGKEFEKIAEIKGNGTTTITTDYSFIDNDLNNFEYYYRLIQVDYDGTSKQVGIVHSKNIFTDEFLKVVNTIVENDLFIRMQEKKSSIIEFDVFDLSGKKIESKSIDTNNGSTSFKIDLSHLSSGSYLINFKLEEKNKMIKVVKI